MRYPLILVGSVLVIYAAAKVILVFQGSNLGPEYITDATLAVLGGIVCFGVAFKTDKKKSH